MHVPRLTLASSSMAAEIGAVLPKIASAVIKGVNATDFNILQNNGKLAGQVVFHLHFHIIPRFENEDQTSGERVKGRLRFTKDESEIIGSNIKAKSLSYSSGSFDSSITDSGKASSMINITSICLFPNLGSIYHNKMEIDTLSIILIALIILFVFLSIRDAPNPDVHPLLLTLQSDAAKVRYPGESAVYRRGGSQHGMSVPEKDAKTLAALFASGTKKGSLCL
ncbi:10858_t:CDS:2, partial [Acaulospora colombiana]